MTDLHPVDASAYDDATWPSLNAAVLRYVDQSIRAIQEHRQRKTATFWDLKRAEIMTTPVESNNPACQMFLVWMRGDELTMTFNTGATLTNVAGHSGMHYLSREEFVFGTQPPKDITAWDSYAEMSVGADQAETHVLDLSSRTVAPGWGVFFLGCESQADWASGYWLESNDPGTEQERRETALLHALAEAIVVNGGDSLNGGTDLGKTTVPDYAIAVTSYASSNYNKGGGDPLDPLLATAPMFTGGSTPNNGGYLQVLRTTQNRIEGTGTLVVNSTYDLHVYPALDHDWPDNSIVSPYNIVPSGSTGLEAWSTMVRVVPVTTFAWQYCALVDVTVKPQVALGSVWEPGRPVRGVTIAAAIWSRLLDVVAKQTRQHNLAAPAGTEDDTGSTPWGPDINDATHSMTPFLPSFPLNRGWEEAYHAVASVIVGDDLNYEDAAGVVKARCTYKVGAIVAACTVAPGMGSALAQAAWPTTWQLVSSNITGLTEVIYSRKDGPEGSSVSSPNTYVLQNTPFVPGVNAQNTPAGRLMGWNHRVVADGTIYGIGLPAKGNYPRRHAHSDWWPVRHLKDHNWTVIDEELRDSASATHASQPERRLELQFRCSDESIEDVSKNPDHTMFLKVAACSFITTPNIAIDGVSSDSDMGRP